MRATDAINMNHIVNLGFERAVATGAADSVDWGAAPQSVALQ